MKKVSYNIKCPECNNLMIHGGFTYSGNREDVEKIFDVPVYNCQKCDIEYVHRENELKIMYIVAEPLQGKIIGIDQERIKIQIDMGLFKRKHQYLHKRITNGLSEIIIKGDIKDFYKDLNENNDIKVMGNYDDGNIVITRDLIENCIFKNGDIVHIEIQQSHLPKVMYLIYFENDPRGAIWP